MKLLASRSCTSNGLVDLVIDRVGGTAAQIMGKSHKSSRGAEEVWSSHEVLMQWLQLCCPLEHLERQMILLAHNCTKREEKTALCGC